MAHTHEQGHHHHHDDGGHHHGVYMLVKIAAALHLPGFTLNPSPALTLAALHTLRVGAKQLSPRANAKSPSDRRAAPVIRAIASNFF